jgi:hypothetical protein
MAQEMKVMKNIDFAVVKFLQFIVFVLFTFIVLTYFGVLVLVPLDILALFVKMATALGLNGFIAAIIGAVGVGYLALSAYKMPGLVKILIDTGLELVQTGKTKIEAFNTLAEAVKK